MSEFLTKRIPRGKGWHNTGTTVATANLTGGDEYLGTVVMFNDEAARTVNAPVSKRSAGQSVFILVQNDSGIALKPGMVCVWKSGYRGTKVGSYAGTVYGEVAGVVDTEWPSSGVPVGEKFWLQIKGHCIVKTAVAADATNVINAGDCLVAVTAANSTNNGSTAENGRVGVAPVEFSAAQATDGTARKVAANWFARAVSAKTTANSNADILVELNTRWGG